MHGTLPYTGLAERAPGLDTGTDHSIATQECSAKPPEIYAPRRTAYATEAGMMFWNQFPQRSRVHPASGCSAPMQDIHPLRSEGHHKGTQKGPACPQTDYRLFSVHALLPEAAYARETRVALQGRVPLRVSTKQRRRKQTGLADKHASAIRRGLS